MQSKVLDMAVSQPVRIALVGGGLHNLLLCVRLLKLHQELQRDLVRQLEIEIFEARQGFDCDKTISCHASDIPLAWENHLEPFWRCKWPAYRVRFPHQPFQDIPIGYRSLHLAGLAEHIQLAAAESAAPIKIHFNRTIRSLPDGFDWVIDSASSRDQGAGRADHERSAGVQQFFGQTLAFREPHGVPLPVVMDCSVPQRGGFCFVYLLPLSAHELLIEDTRLLRTAQSWQALETAVPAYLPQLGLEKQPHKIVHEERGILPIPLCSFKQWQGSGHQLQNALSEHEGASATQTRSTCVGFRAGYFHPTTGYSLPLALRSAESLYRDIDRLARTSQSKEPSGLSDLERPRSYHFDAFGRACNTNWQAALIFNRFLLWGFRPNEAHHAFAYFYALPLVFIKRFYGAELRLRDLKTILLRLPPRRFSLSRLGFQLLRFWFGRRVKQKALPE